jgi:phospho-N-acetylmuramoyl-pentapeptide-transferase
MLYYLFRFLEQWNIPGSGMWSYISFRSLLALVLSLIISVWFGEYFIKWMRSNGGTETQRDRSIDPFGQKKLGVPTMGGLIIIVATVVPCLLFGRLRNIYMLLMIVTTLWLGAIGFADDYIKMKITKDGLQPKYKLIGQALLGLVIGLTLWLSPDAVIRENVSAQKTVNGKETIEVVMHKSNPVKSTTTTIPFVKNNNLNYTDTFFSWMGKHKSAGGWIFFVFLTTFLVMAVSNGSNLNDGMDGMCAGNSAIICVALGILAYVSSHIGYAAYFNIMYVPQSEELVIFLSAFVGALIGFLWYNAYPAQVFMGDTGSLAIGGIIAVTAVIIHKELLIPILCFIFLCESISVMVQMRVAKYGNKRGMKLRMFKRAPIHDAFRTGPEQLEGLKVILNRPHGRWLESKITTRFWIITIGMAALAIITLKIR